MKDIASLFEALPFEIANNIVVDHMPPLDYECIKAFGRYGYFVKYKPNSGHSGYRENTRPISKEESNRLIILGNFRVTPDYVGGGCAYYITGGKSSSALNAKEAVIIIWNNTKKLRSGC